MHQTEEELLNKMSLHRSSENKNKFKKKEDTIDIWQCKPHITKSNQIKINHKRQLDSGVAAALKVALTENTRNPY